MPLIELSKNKIAIIDEEDFDLIKKHKWHYHHNIRGRTGYALTTINQKAVRMHALILGKKSGFCIDHVDGNGLNNTRKNLRFVTPNQNRWNVGMYKNNKTGLKGVSKISGYHLYRAQIKIFGKVIYLGCFRSPEDAHQAYCEAAIKYHGEFAKF